jgi:hypothetical protein
MLAGNQGEKELELMMPIHNDKEDDEASSMKEKLMGTTVTSDLVLNPYDCRVESLFNFFLCYYL